MKLLFLTKARYEYSETVQGKPIGLANSANFMTVALQDAGYSVKHEAVVDGNSIDKEVATYLPDVVVLEALWVTPTKMQELASLHPTVKWLVRLHSNIPFLSMEGIAFAWCREYALIPNVVVSANNKQTSEELEKVLSIPVLYLPNIYLAPDYTPGKGKKRKPTHLDISCFGAIRPLKNQLIQACAAVAAANQLGKKLRYHINGKRVEQKGDSVLRNIIALFENTEHELILHEWMEHEEFLLTVAKMDVGLQVSFTESFNIVAADHVHVGVPLVVSSEINWLPNYTQAKTTNMDSIKDAIIYNISLGEPGADNNERALGKYNTRATNQWVNFLTNGGSN